MSGSCGFLLVALFSRVISFDVDWAVFRAGPDTQRIELAYGIPYDQLEYSPGESAEAVFNVDVELVGLDSDYRESGSLRRRARIGSFSEAEASSRMVVDQFGVLAPPGRYSLSIRVADSAGSGSFNDTIEVPGFKDGPAMSSVQLGIGFVTDSAGSGFAVVPNPGRRFVVGASSRVYLYLEVYNLRPSPESCAVVCRIVRLDGPVPDTVVRTPVLWRRKSERSIFAGLGISIDGLEPGEYRLVAFADDGAGRPAVAKTADFSVVRQRERAAAGQGVTRLTGLSESEARYYRELQFIATPAELAYYNSLNDSGKEAYLVRFWKRHDLAEFSRRMAVVESRYNTGRLRGAQTDRGRIYITYGEPDAVEQRVMEMESRPREYWHYYGPGYSFIFADIRADGNYRLIWTNSPHEGPTGLTQYLTPEEQEQFR